MPPKPKANSPERLVGTSQGKASELPPKLFIREELVQFGTMGTPAEYFADLPTKALVFERGLFQMTDDRWEALQQSLALTEILFAAALPYLANFLPVANLTDNERSRRLIIKEDISMRGWKHMIIASRILFKQILPTITWNEDNQMWPQRGVMGLNHTGQESAMAAIRQGEGPQEWEDYTEECEGEGLAYRHITITLASQLVDTILASEPNTEQHMNALFAAAINITHELGHTIFLANMKNFVDYFWVGNDIHAETGHSLIAYIFNGWYPEPINLEEKHNNKDFMAFRNGHAWHKMHRRPCQEPFAEVEYSMPMEHIQRLFNIETWLEFRELTHESFPAMRRTIFPPLAPFKIGRHARCARILATGHWRRRLSRSGYKEEDADDDEDDWEEGLIYGPPKKVFFDADWDDALTEKEEAIRDERNRKYVIDLTHPYEVVVISSDDDDDKPKKGKGKAAAGKTFNGAKAGTKAGMKAGMKAGTKASTKAGTNGGTNGGTKEGKSKTPTKEELKKGKPRRPPCTTTTPGSSSSPATGRKKPTKKSTAAGKNKATEGNKAQPKTTGRKTSGKKRGTASPEDDEEQSPKKRPKTGGKSASSKSGKSASSEPSGSKSNPTITRSTPSSAP